MKGRLKFALGALVAFLVTANGQGVEALNQVTLYSSLKTQEWHLDRVSTGSGSDLVQSRRVKIVRKYRMLIIDQVATAPCTDPIQE